MIELILEFDPHLWIFLTQKQWLIIWTATLMMLLHTVTWVKWTMAFLFFMFAMSHIVAEWCVLSFLLILAYETANLIFEKAKNFITLNDGRTIRKIAHALLNPDLQFHRDG